MRVPYTKIRSNNPSIPFFLRPHLEILIINGMRNVRLSAQIDTGADQILINKSWASHLGIEWKKGDPSYTYGIIPPSPARPTRIPTYIHQVEVEVMNLPQSRKRMPVGFINSPNVGALLGQIGFFDNFRVSFERFNNFFEIESRPGEVH